ncbi:TonB-dependent receptor [Pseudoalteromonas neustonica]
MLYRLLSMVIITPLAFNSFATQSPIERITTTASRTETLADPLPVVVSTISEQQLALIAPTHIEQVLKQIAGANIQHGNGQEYLPALRSAVLTGAGACASLLSAEDGIPLRAAGFCNINELFEAHTEMAERIEVLKGPGSALYGSNAVHGVINVITPDTTYGDSLLGIDTGSYGYKRLKLRSGKDFGTQGISFNASITRDSGYRDDESVNQEKLNLRYRFESNDLLLSSGLTYTHLDQQTAGFITGFESYKDQNLAQANLNPDAFRKARSFRAWSKAQWQSSNNIVTITPYFRNQSMDFLKHFLPGTPLEKNAQTGFGIQSLWQHNYNNDIRIHLGFDTEYTAADFLQNQNEPTQGSAFLVATVPQGKHYDYDVNSTLYAPFISVNWHVKALTISAGARFEHIRYDYDNNMLAGRTRDDGTVCEKGGCRYSRPASSKNSFSNLSPKLGLSYQLNNNHYIYANVSQGYRAPQAAELYQLQRDQEIAELKSETADNLELGLKGHYQQLHYVLSAYAMNKQHSIFRDSDFFTVNDGKSHHRGVEVELNYALSKSIQLALAATHAKHSYSYNQILNDININGNDIDTAPRTLANMQINYQPTDTTQLALEWHHVSRYFTDPENRHEYTGHHLFNLRSAWQLTPQLTLAARITNLTNKAYAERADYTSFSGERYFPGKPRSFMLSASYTW